MKLQWKRKEKNARPPDQENSITMEKVESEKFSYLAEEGEFI